MQLPTVTPARNYTAFILKVLRRIAKQHWLLGVLDGLIFGAAFQAVLAQFLMVLGASDALVVTTVIACGLSASTAMLARRPVSASFAGQGLCWMLFAAWLAVSPLLLKFSGTLVTRYSMPELAGLTQAGLGLTLLPAAALCFSVPAALALLLPASNATGWFGLGVAMSALVLPVYLGQLESLSAMTLVLAVGGSLRGAWLLGRSWRGSSANAHRGNELATVYPLTTLILSAFALLAAGAGLAVTTQVGRQLLATQISSHLAGWSGALIGAILGYVLTQARTTGNTHSQLLLSPACTDYKTATSSITRPPQAMTFAALCLLGSGGLLAIVGGYGFWAWASLWITAWVQDIRLIYLCRGVLLAVMPLPLGLVIGSATRVMAGHPRTLSLAIPCLLTGWLAAYASDLHPVAVALTASSTLLAIGMVQWWSALYRTTPINRRTVGLWKPATRYSLPALALVLLAVGIVTRHNYRPDLSEKYLFSAGTFTAFRNGTAVGELPFLDDGRLLWQRETVRGRTSVWKHRGLQFAVRQDGIAIGWQSGAPQLSPDNLAEISAVVLPLVTHATADRVLILGNEGTAGVFTALSFPVRQVTAVAGTSQLQASLAELGANSTLNGLLKDERLTQVELDPALAGKASGEPFDVIVAQPSQSNILRNTALYTDEFYRGIRSKLATEGIFCQRLNYFDYGPGVVRRVVNTFHRTFPNMIVTESTPGELLLMGSSREGRLFNVTTISELKREHTRDVLSRVGWDWSMVANLGGLDTAACEKFSAGQSSLQASGSTLAFAFPREVARWGDKWNNSRGALARHGEMLGNWLGDVVELDEIRQRLEDVKASREVVTEHPDQFWAYRSVIKTQLQKRPRTEIVQTSGSLKYGLHHEDERRKDYLEVLGDAAGKKSPSNAEIQRLNDFIAPYDPLVSYFLHQEAAYMLERSQSRESGSQLAHWLHSIYFAAGHDRSVRHICSAIKLLHDEPTSVPDDAARFDHLHGLLEMLLYRWSLRYQSTERSRFEPIDTEQSIAVTMQALDDMQRLALAAGVSAEEWRIRRVVLEDNLLRPLRAHRSNQARQIAVSQSEPPPASIE